MVKFVIVHVLAFFCYGGGAVWGIVEGLQYFVKDQPVNWWFLLPLIGGIVIFLLNVMNALTYRKGRWPN